MIDPFDTTVAAWIRREGPEHAPAAGLAAALGAAAALEQRPRWRVREWWLGAGSTNAVLPAGRAVGFVGLTVLLLIAAAAVAVIGTSRPPTFQLAYVTQDRLFIASADGSGAHRIGPVPAPGFSTADLRWSPDHTYIAWLLGADRGDRLLILDPSGSIVGAYDAPTTALRIAWAPDSRRIAVYSEELGTQIDLLDVTGAQAGSIPLAVDLQVGYPGWLGPISWSPDGRWIALPGCGVGRCIGKAGTDIYALPVAGGSPVRLTSDGAGDGWVAWAPDGRLSAIRLCTSATATCIPGALIVGPRPVAGSAPAIARIPGLDEALLGWLAWSPDGRSLAATRNVPGSATTVANELVLVDASGNVTRSIGGWSQADVVDWTADGRTILLRAVPSGGDTASIWAVDVAGGSPRLVADDVDAFDLDGRP